MDRFAAMEVFVRVVTRRSFSAVAKERGVGQPAISKQVAALEESLGTELLRRGSRQIALTDAGQEFYESSVRILEELEVAASRAGRRQETPRGLLRVIVPATFARLHVVTKLAAFFEAYPEVSVELTVSDHPTADVEDGYDLAVHSGDLKDSSLVARRFAQTTVVLVATPRSLTLHGLPQSVEDLRGMPAVVTVERGVVMPWEFGHGEERQRIVPTGVFRTNDLEQTRMGVLEHLGIAQAPAWLFAAELREGTVMRLLPKLERVVPMFTVRPASRKTPAKVKVFVEHLEKTFAVCTQFNPPQA